MNNQKIQTQLARTKEKLEWIIKVQITTWIHTYANEEKGLSNEIISEHFDKKKKQDQYIENRFRNLQTKSHRNLITKDEKGKIIAWLGCWKKTSPEGSFAIYVLP